MHYKVDLSVCRNVDVGGTVVMCEKDEHFDGVAEVYDIYSERLNMSSVRDSERWERERKKIPSKHGITTYLWKDDEGVPRSYFKYKIGKDDGEMFLDVQEICFTDGTALQALLSFVRAFNGFYSRIHFIIPTNIDARFLFTEHYDVKKEVWLNGMVRVVNVKAALKGAKVKGSGVVVIEIIDRQIPENDGIWRVRFDKDEVKVRRPKATDKKQKPDMTLPIHAFSCLLTGGMTFDNVDYYPDITVNGNREDLTKLFTRKMIWNNERF
jgi:predicted acetyltransferase